MHVQTNASVDSSETSTKLLECRLDLLSLVWTLSHADSPLLRCPVSTASVRCPSPTAHFSVPFCLLSDRRPLTTPVTSRSRIQNPLSGFAPKQTKESSAWRTTYIVLQKHYFITTIGHVCSTT